jgi:hypothetical protein
MKSMVSSAMLRPPALGALLGSLAAVRLRAGGAGKMPAPAPAPQSWRAAAPMARHYGEHAFAPQVAMDSGGNAIAVWQQWDGARFSIWTNWYVRGLGWGRGECIAPTENGEATCPQIAMDATGDAIAVWQQSDGVRTSIWAAQYLAGRGWGAAEPINANMPWSAFGASLAMDAGGNAVAVWEQSDGARLTIWANRYVANTGWAGAQRIDATNAGNAVFAQVALSAQGDAIAVWQQPDGAVLQIWASFYTAGLGWGAAQVIDSRNAGVASGVQAAMDADGNAWVVWEHNDGAHTNIWAKHYLAGGGWGATELIEADTRSAASEPHIVMDAGGNAFAVWERAEGARSGIWANRYAAGSGWGTAARIEASSADSALSPRIALDAQGNAMAVWLQWDGARRNVWANRYVADKGWSGAVLIDANDLVNSAFSPRVAMNAGGGAVAVWGQSDGERSEMWTSDFN